MNSAHAHHDIREERRKRLREAMAASSAAQLAQDVNHGIDFSEPRPQPFEVESGPDSGHGAAASNLQSAALVEQMRIIDDIRAGKAGKSSVRCIPQGDEYQTGKCLFHYTVTTITQESFSGTFTIDIHFPYRLVSQSQSLGGMYQRVILTQTYPSPEAQGENKSPIGRSVDLINLELDLNTARLFYKDVAVQMDAAVQGELEALKPPMKEVPASPPQSDTQNHKEQPQGRAEFKQQTRIAEERKRAPRSKAAPKTVSNSAVVTPKVLILTSGVLLAAMFILILWVMSLKMNSMPFSPQAQTEPMEPLTQPHTPNRAKDTEGDTLWQPN